MDTSFAVMIALYWLYLTGVVFLSGAFSSRIMVTGPSGADVCVPSGARRCLGETAARFTFTVAIATATAHVLHLVMHASIMTETTLPNVLSILWPFLTKTRYGRFAIIKSVFLIILMAISFLGMKKERPSIQIAGMAGSAGLLVLMAMSGHQGARGYWNTGFVLDVIHLFSISLWTGGLFLLRVCFRFLILHADFALRETFTGMFNRFSTLATYCVAVVVLTGGLLAYLKISSWNLLTERSYGKILLIKVITVSALVLLGGANKFIVVPALNRAVHDRWNGAYPFRKRLYLLVSMEVWLAIGVLLNTSILTHLSPEQ